MRVHTEKQLSKDIYRKAFVLAKDYFLKSDEKYKACAMLLGAVLTTIALVALAAAFSWWFSGFWAALTAMNIALFAASMKTFVILTVGAIGLDTLKNYLTDSLGIRWRNWLTKQYIKKLFSKDDDNYLDLMRLPNKVDNPQQRIQEDVRTFVETTLSLSTSLLSSGLSLITFIGTLWVVGGALSFVLFGASITIPGYLVWGALLFAGFASIITHKIGHQLAKINREQETNEAEFRKEMEMLSNQSESVGQEHGEVYYKHSLETKLLTITQTANEQLSVKNKLVGFQSFYVQIASIFPYICAAPLYFIGLNDLGQLMQIGFSFGAVNTSLNWFIDSYEKLAVYKASIDRILELENALSKEGGLGTAKKHIILKEHENADVLDVSNLSISTPESTGYILKGLQLRLKRGENTLIKGPSGLGKSTLFKVMAGTWKYGDGKVDIPESRKMCFLAQRSSIPNDTLKAILAYPNAVETYPDEAYKHVLREVGNMELFIGQLDTIADWSKRLSPGQQQRISFARALLSKPDWLFLDETTASLDEVSENRMYHLVKDTLPQTTFISIAHRASVEAFHDRIVNFDRLDEDGVISLSERQVAPMCLP